MNDFLRSLPGYSVARKLIKSALPPSREQWQRVVMNRETAQLVSRLQPETLNVLEVSGAAWARKLPFRSYRSTQFPDYDLCEGPLDDKFELVIAEQVFEHLLWPYRAGRHVKQMLSPGGHFLVTVPFLIRPHGAGIDCTRWTELGLRCLLVECGFDEDRVVTGSWGNRACVISNLSRWTPHNRLLHSLRDDPRYPVVVWALAQNDGHDAC